MALKTIGLSRLATVSSKETLSAFLSMSISCTFENMRANVRVEKQDVVIHQLSTVVFVFMTQQLQYLACTLDQDGALLRLQSSVRSIVICIQFRS